MTKVRIRLSSRIVRTLSVAIVILSITPTPAAAWSLTAVGDLMLDRQVRVVVRKVGLPALVQPVRKYLQGDVVLGNLEGPFTTNRSVADTGALTFTFDPGLAPVLKRIGFNTLSLANNHTLNFGRRGLDNTRTVLKKAGLKYFGDPNNLRGFTLIRSIRGERVAFIGYHGLVSGKDRVIQEIKSARRRAGFVIVVPHWGAEYQLRIQPRLQAEARQLINAGADMVIGGHPHVIEPIEVYKGKFIAYSLGNFIFDQYWSTETQRGLMLNLTFDADRISICFRPVTARRSVVTPASRDIRRTILDRIAAGSPNSQTIKKQVRAGTLVLPRH